MAKRYVLPAAPRAWCHYRVAGRLVAIDGPLPVLAPYRNQAADEALVSGPADGPPAAEAAGEIEGLVGGALRRVAVWHELAGSWLELPGVGTVWVGADGSRLSVSATPVDVDERLLVEYVLGPGLTLALANQSTFCLHASAVHHAGRALAFVGESGSGKSTLAALLAGGGPGGWPRLTDDILPVTREGGQVLVQADFPQLKLAAHEALPPQDGLLPMPLAAVYELSPPPFAAVDDVTIERLPPRQTALTLLNHTVAHRLFPETVARRHFEDFLAIAGQVPVRRLHYPRRHDIGPAVAAAIAADLAALPPVEPPEA